MQRREFGRWAAVALSASLILPSGLSAQNLKSYVGRWVMQKDTTTVTVAPAGDTSAAAANTLAGRIAARNGRNRPARAAGGTVDTTQAGANRAAAINRVTSAGRQISQTLTVSMKGDTIFSIDSTLVATGNAIVRVDTLIADGQSRAHSSALGQGLATQRAGGRAGNNAAANPRVAQALAARNNGAGGGGLGGAGTRTVSKDASTNGFAVKDSLSMGNANRAITVRTTQKWSLSADGKTLTIVTLLSTDNGVTPTTRIFDLQLAAKKG